jgi:hypothetical protein
MMERPEKEEEERCVQFDAGGEVGEGVAETLAVLEVRELHFDHVENHPDHVPSTKRLACT